jgi:HAD superfamily hydrolase (TIGR01549 family)
MVNISLLIFDLDGTLVDSKKVIINSVNFALKKLNLKLKTYREIEPYLGIGVNYLIKKVTESENTTIINKGVNYFNDYWKDHLKNESRLFPGVRNTLEYFKTKNMLILSNGTIDIIRKILENFKLDKYFDDIITGDEEDCIKPTACPVNKALNIHNIKNKEETLIIGDMDIDIKAGKEAGILTCGVTYGMGKRKDLIKSNPDFLIDRITELRSIIN